MARSYRVDGSGSDLAGLVGQFGREVGGEREIAFGQVAGGRRVGGAQAGDVIAGQHRLDRVAETIRRFRRGDQAGGLSLEGDAVGAIHSHWRERRRQPDAVQTGDLERLGDRLGVHPRLEVVRQGPARVTKGLVVRGPRRAVEVVECGQPPVGGCRAAHHEGDHFGTLREPALDVAGQSRRGAVSGQQQRPDHRGRGDGHRRQACDDGALPSATSDGVQELVLQPVNVGRTRAHRSNSSAVDIGVASSRSDRCERPRATRWRAAASVHPRRAATSA